MPITVIMDETIYGIGIQWIVWHIREAKRTS
jgi:hypothetical protein